MLEFQLWGVYRGYDYFKVLIWWCGYLNGVLIVLNWIRLRENLQEKFSVGGNKCCANAPKWCCGYVESLAMCEAEITISVMVRLTWQVKERSL